MKRTFLLFVLLAACSSDETSAITAGSDAGTGGDAASDDGACCGDNGEAQPPRRVFVTRALRSGANGGIEGADALCQEEGKNINGIKYVAWLSTPTKPAVERLRKDVAFITSDGKIVWQGREQIEAGKPPAFPITAGADGKPVTGVTHVWTGTSATGKPTGEHCNEWTTNNTSAMGTAGVFGSTGTDWTADSATKDCGQAYALLCFASE